MKSPKKQSVDLFLLGSFELKINGQTAHLPTRKIETLLAYLTLHPHAQKREKIASMLWGDSPEELARRSLRTALSALRKELGEECLISDRESIQLNPAFSLWVDVQEMEKQTKDIPLTHSPITSAINLNLYRGDLLQDFYDEWVLGEREHYRNLYLNALLQLAQFLRMQGEYPRVIEISQRIVAIDPVNERAYQHLLFCYGALGDRSAALKTYKECSFQLQEKLGVSPSEDTEMLYQHVKKSAASGISPQLVKSNLPIPLTSFIGREQELTTLKEIFNRIRLLTLTGVGGCGKTRLSIQLAGQIADQYADGVWWIELASVQDEKLLVQTVKKTLGIADSPNDSAEESMLKFLRTKQNLLVLDNCEHMIAACAGLAENILSHCPNVKILATSREALNIYGETAWLVPSLSLPPLDQTQDIMNWECSYLFFVRASAYRPDLQLTETNALSVGRICHALDGIPLAIELAAARVKTLSLEQLAARLDDKLSLLTTGSRTAQPRQQTLRATIDWSYELLSETEQITLQRLSILAGNWTLEAAESIAGRNEITLAQSLDLITRLLDKSLLVADSHEGEIRYRMLEIIRQYAFEKLQEANEVEKVKRQHLLYYSGLAHLARPHWFTSKHASLMKQFDVDYPNLRVALAWGLESPSQSTNWYHGSQLAADMGPLWNFLGDYAEGQEWLKKAINQVNVTLAESNVASDERIGLLSIKAKLLYEYGFLVWFQGQYSKSRTIFMESSELYKKIEDPTGLAYSEMFLAHSTWGLGQAELARKMWAQSLDQFMKVSDRWGAAMVHSFLGRAERESGNYDHAEREYDQCLELFGAVGDGWGLGISLSHLGMIAFQKNQPEKARKLFEQRLNISREHDFRQSTAYSIFLLGAAYWKLGDPVQVQRHMREALAHYHRLGNYFTLTECIVGLAWAEAELGRSDQAAYLLGVIEKADQTFRISNIFEDVYFRRPIIADLQSRLDSMKYKDAIERGRNMTLDQVAKEILAA